MKIGIIAEGFTEYESVPKLVGKLGHSVVGRNNLRGIGEEFPWEALFERKIFPLVRAYALRPYSNRPDKVLIVIDRENRPECCGQLAALGSSVLQNLLSAESLSIATSIVLPNRCIECWLFAQPELLDTSPLFKRPIALQIGNAIDEKNILQIVKNNLAPNKTWDKIAHGKLLAQAINLSSPSVLARSRSLRKFVKELT